MFKKCLKFPETFILFSYSPKIPTHTTSLLGKSQKRKKKPQPNTRRKQNKPPFNARPNKS